MSANRSAVALKFKSDKQADIACTTERNYQAERIDIVNPIEYEGWDDMLLASRDCTFFHTTAWAKVLSQTYNYKPVYFIMTVADRLLAMVPMMEIDSRLTGRRGVSLPFTDYCESPVSNDVDIDPLLHHIEKYARARNWKSIEYRGRSYCNVPVCESYYSHVLSLNPNIQELESALKSNTRRSIKKAVREGVEVGQYNSLQALDEYYRLHCLTRKKHGLPPQPHSFFKKIYEHIISKNLGMVVLASYRGQNIAGAVFFHYGDTAIYKFGASDQKFLHVRPVDLVMWEAIRHYAKNGYHSFCFGRTAQNNEGLRQFKTRWGAQERTIDYYKFDLQKNAFIQQSPTVKESHYRLFRMMPIPVLKALGAILYRHMG